MNSVEIVELKTDKRQIGFIIQLICALILLIFGLVALFTENFLDIVYLLVSINMIVLTVNGLLFLKKGKFVLLYVAVAVYFFVLFLKGIL